MKKVVIGAVFYYCFLSPQQLLMLPQIIISCRKSLNGTCNGAVYSLLLTNILEAVSHYYSDYLTISPLVFPYQIKILDMERTNGYRAKSLMIIGYRPFKHSTCIENH